MLGHSHFLYGLSKELSKSSGKREISFQHFDFHNSYRRRFDRGLRPRSTGAGELRDQSNAVCQL